MQVKFHKNLKILRKRKNVGQDELAKVLEVTRTAVSGYENQTIKPNFDKLISIANYFKISLDDLVYADLSNTEISIKNSEIEVIRRENELLRQQIKVYEKLTNNLK